MKKLLLIVTLLTAGFSFTQDKITLTLKGLTEEVNAALQPGEYIQDLRDVDRKMYIFYAQVKNTEGGSSSYVRISEGIAPDAEGNYDFSISFDVPKKGSLDFSKEISVSIKALTTFGNDIWVEKNIKPEDFAQPIWVDSYGNSFRPSQPKKEIIKFTFKGAGKSDSITKVLTAEGDALKTLTQADFHFQARNVGSETWTINESPTTGLVDRGKSLLYEINPKTTKLDITKPIEYHICYKTVNDGIVWQEFTLDPWELGGVHFIGKNYAKVQECELPSEDDVVEEEEEEHIEDEQDVDDPQEEEEIENTDNQPEPETIVIKCDVDSITTQIQLKGGQLCVKHAKVFRGTQNSAILLYDTPYELDGVTYLLQGGQPVYYHNKSNFLMGATLAEAISVDHPLGKLEIAANKKIEFTLIGLYAVKLSKAAILDYKGTQISVKQTDNEYDLAFDKIGKLRYLTLGGEVNWNIGATTVKMPTDSYLSFENDKLKRVTLVNNTTIAIGAKTFSVVPAKKGASMIFNKAGDLASFITGDGHSIMVDGKEVNIQSGSAVEVTKNGSEYIIKSIETAAPITMDVHKGSKVKEVAIKAGKRLIIEGGKVVKVK
jgi:hypothetical protein